MTDELREIAGFLCRWLLLALVAVMLAGAAVAAAMAAEAITVETAADAVLPDGIAREGHSVLLVGYVQPRLPYSASGVMLYRRGGDARVGSVGVRDGQVNWSPAVGQAGLRRIDFRGQPYGPLALERHSVRLLVVSTEQKLYLVDAVWAERLSDNRRNELAEMLSRMDADGAVALFHTGPVGDFNHCRETLRERGFQHAVLMDVDDDGDPAYVLRRTARRIRRWRHNRNMFVITDDADLAAAAAADGFRTHLLTTRPDPPPADDNLRIHHTLEELKDDLPLAPIP